MAGLVEKQMNGGNPAEQQSAGAPGQAPAPRQGRQAGGQPSGQQQGGNRQANEQQDAMGEQASEEEQEQYERLVLGAVKLMYDDASHQGLMQMLQQGADDPAGTIAQVTMNLMNQLVERMGGDLMGSVVPWAAKSIIEQVGTLANTAGVFEVDEATVNAAAQQMLAMVAEQFGVDPSEIEQLLGEMDPEQIEQAVTQQSQFAEQAAGARPGGGQPGQQQPQPAGGQPGQQPPAGGPPAGQSQQPPVRRGKSLEVA